MISYDCDLDLVGLGCKRLGIVFVFVINGMGCI